MGIDYKKIAVDVVSGENTTDEFLMMNPNGLVPVLIDGEKTIYDSAAILSYLAKNYANKHWLPNDAMEFAKIIRWLVFEQSEGRYGLARARAMCLNNPTPLARLGSLEEAQMLGVQALEILNKQLLETNWLAGGEKATIADIACYPYTAMSVDGGLSLAPYNAIKRWMKNIEHFDSYIALPAI